MPRIWEKLKAAIEAGIEHEEDEDKKNAMKGALDVGLKKVRLEQAGEEVPEELAQGYAQADEKVFSKIRERLGFDRAESVNVGAAPTPPEVIEFFHAIGIPLAELWGMSETCGAGCINPPDKIKVGTVGRPLPGVELKLADDGEILMRSDMTMVGYRKQAEDTAQAIDADGWLHSGDIGAIDEDGFLKIVDRKKDIIISAAGKNMSPSNIEGQIKIAGPLRSARRSHRRRPPLQRGAAHPRRRPPRAPSAGDDPERRQGGRARRSTRPTALSRVEQVKKFTLLDGGVAAGRRGADRRRRSSSASRSTRSTQPRSRRSTPTELQRTSNTRPGRTSCSRPSGSRGRGQAGRGDRGPDRQGRCHSGRRSTALRRLR